MSGSTAPTEVGVETFFHGPDGQRRYGQHGAAGLLIWTDLGAGACVLLAQRSRFVHQPGTWAVPGGARARDESAAECALREAAEEIPGLDAKRLGFAAGGELVVEFPGGWTYTYVIARAYGLSGVPVGLSGAWETLRTQWVSLDALTRFKPGVLHPDFAAAVPALQARIRGTM